MLQPHFCKAGSYIVPPTDFFRALASREGVYARDFLDSVGFGVTQPTPLFIDSKAALDLTADPVAFKKTKHILRHAYELRPKSFSGSCGS